MHRYLAILFFFIFTSVLLASPQQILYQGEIELSGSSFSGNISMKFVLHNGSDALWSNDGTGDMATEPTQAVEVYVDQGLYSVALGDSSSSNMTSLNSAVLGQSQLQLRVWVDDGSGTYQLMSPDKNFYAVPFAQSVVDGHIENSSANLSALSVGSLTFPTTTGSANQALITDGFGNLTWSDQSSVSSNVEISMVRLDTTNGYGSTATMIRRFSNVVDEFGSAIAYTDSATDGASFIAQADGVYSIVYSDSFGSQSWFGISVNSNELTTEIGNMTDSSDRLVMSTKTNNNIHSPLEVTWIGFLNAGDVVRPHSEGIDSSTSPSLSSWTMTYHGQLSTGNAISSGSYNSLSETSGTLSATGNLVVTGSTNLGGLLIPTTTGSTNQVLTTDGFGVLSWSDHSAVSANLNHSMIRLNTGNGFGSTNGAIRRFSDLIESIGSSIVYADSVTEGASFTIQVDGVYHISYSDRFTTLSSFGVSLNSTELNASVSTINNNDRLIITNIAEANKIGSASWVGILNAGDVIRAHTAGPGLSDHSTPNHVSFTITHIGTTTSANLISSSSSYDSLTESSGTLSATGNLVVGGSTNLNGLVFPNTTGNSGQLLSVGADGTLDWMNADVASGANAYAFKAYMTADNQVMAGWTPREVINFDATEFDTTGGALINGGNTFKPTIEGFYLLTARAEIEDVDLDEYGVVEIYKNGVFHAEGSLNAPDQEPSEEVHVGSVITTIVYANGTTDYFEARVYHTHNEAKAVDGDVEETWFSGVLLSSTSGGSSVSIDGLTSQSGNLTATSNLTVTGSTNLGGLLFPMSTGSANQVLSTDGLGNLSWSTVAAVSQGNAIAFKATRDGSNPAITANSATLVDFATLEFDNTGDLNAAGNRFTPTTAGVYLLNATTTLSGMADGTSVGVVIYKNGSEIARGSRVAVGLTSSTTSVVSTIVDSPANGDYYEVYVIQSDTDGGNESYTAGSSFHQFSGVLLAPSTITSGGNVENLISSNGNLVASGNFDVTGDMILSGNLYSNPYSNDHSNMALGVDAMGNGTLSGYRNTAIGTNTLQFISSGYSNTAIGYNSLQDVTSGEHNTGLGASSLTSTTSGNSNVAIGNFSLAVNSEGISNTAVGVNSLRSNQDGVNNVAIGRDAAFFNVDGWQNVAIGVSALRNNISGNYNIAIGNGAGANLISGNNNIVIGSLVELSQTNVSNELNIGDLITGDMSSKNMTIQGNLNILGSSNLNGLIMPDTTGSVNQILVDDGTGSLNWQDPFTSVFFRASDLTSNVINTGLGTVDFDTVDFDNLSNFDVDTGIYTVSVNGTYHVGGHITFQNSGSWVLGEEAILRVKVNGSNDAVIGYFELMSSEDASSRVRIGGSTIVQLSVGDTVELHARKSNSGGNSEPGIGFNQFHLYRLR